MICKISPLFLPEPSQMLFWELSTSVKQSQANKIAYTTVNVVGPYRYENISADSSSGGIHKVLNANVFTYQEETGNSCRFDYGKVASNILKKLNYSGKANVAYHTFGLTGFPLSYTGRIFTRDELREGHRAGYIANLISKGDGKVDISFAHVYISFGLSGYKTKHYEKENYGKTKRLYYEWYPLSENDLNNLNTQFAEEINKKLAPVVSQVKANQGTLRRTPERCW